MEMTNKLKERFCKDCKIPINIFDEPYFTDRIKLFDVFYDSVEKWCIFLSELNMYKSEEEYFEEYNKIKDLAIENIKNSEAFINFNNEDMNQYRIKHEGLPVKDIYKSNNDKRKFISIDMKKANFSALKMYDERMFNGEKTWEDFMSKFTNNLHIINSKYIRQVILGNCNPKRQITYEKFIMDNILDRLLTDVDINNIVFFSNDEIVIDVTDFEEEKAVNLTIKYNTDEFPTRAELFTLHKIFGTEGYYKKFIYGEKNIEFKGLDGYLFPFVARTYLNEKITENDKVFYHGGRLAKYIGIPEIIM